MAARWKLLPRRRRTMIGAAHWSRALARSRYASALSTDEQQRLRELVASFLAIKSFDGAAGFEITAEVRAVIALKACIPILKLDLDYYSGWTDIVVYPGDFRVRDAYMDDVGVVHEEARELCGESLSRGPIVLSWQAMEEELQAADRDLVIHECAHKLDILNGDANGFPPLHRDMSTQRWSRTFSEAYERFGHEVDTDESAVALDPYAATDPAEFFAVATETFFTCPAILFHDFSEVYAELARFYRQDTYSVLGDSA